MIPYKNAGTNQISRSLLQKSVRRGDSELLRKIINLLIIENDFDWLRKRLAVITYEECWQYGSNVSFEKNENVVEYHYLELCRTIKNKNAAGLGSLAYALSESDDTVSNSNIYCEEIRIIANAIKKPKEFWSWISNQCKTESLISFVSKAESGYRKASWPWDKAFIQAAAFLSITQGIPSIHYLEQETTSKCPLWVGIDKHTIEGKNAIRKAATSIGLEYNKALWLSFYFESALCNKIEDSPWWEKEIIWRLGKIGYSIEAGKRKWEELIPIVTELLQVDVKAFEDRLHSSSNGRPIQTSLF